MNTNLALVLLLLAAAIVMFMANRPRMDAVALLMIVIMPFTGVITINDRHWPASVTPALC